MSSHSKSVSVLRVSSLLLNEGEKYHHRGGKTLFQEITEITGTRAESGVGEGLGDRRGSGGGSGGRSPGTGEERNGGGDRLKISTRGGGDRRGWRRQEVPFPHTTSAHSNAGIN